MIIYDLFQSIKQEFTMMVTKTTFKDCLKIFTNIFMRNVYFVITGLPLLFIKLILSVPNFFKVFLKMHFGSIFSLKLSLRLKLC